GGIWRNFLTKYPEGNNLHKKMLRVSNQVHMAHLQKDQRRGLSRHRLRQSLKALHAGQCNDAYWHGIFGGLYLPHLRRAVYRELLTAESLLLEGPSTLRPGSGQASLRAGGGFKNSAAAVHETDFDLDGRAELLIERPDQNLYVSPHEGGTLFEWDLKPFRVNLGDVLTRRQEAYHRELEASGVRDHPSGVGGGSAKTIHERSRGADPQLSSLRVVDSARRLSLMDRFLAAETTRQDLWQGRARECGDFIHGQYAWAIHRGSMPAVVLKRQGTVQGAGGRFLIELEKVIQAIPGMGWTVNYRFQNLGTHSTPLHFAVECNWAFGTATPQEHSEHHAVSHWERPDPVTGLTLQVECHPAAGVWTFPVETLSTSEQGFEGVYQGTAVLFHWQVTASPRQWQTMHLQVAVSRLA
ncbi:MAG: DUF1926 domain-containing protein, partial [Elusimicrobia bacterium]|nr:DUF1926 domain-containing protein [Elusimicrobiota bacterium]